MPPARRQPLAPFPPGRIRYPAELPVTARREDIREAISGHQVVVVSGETGSGKTTQIPKICLELGRGTAGLIGHTQPRRLAARTVAERVAEELGSEVGGTVGYAVRFTDRVGPGTMVKLMTDGILLAELARDRSLSAYDTLIIDEAHERSLNIDFILGYIKALLPRRPDLKVVITSATIDTERFSRHFDDAPVVEVSGRSWPVEVRYRPPGADEDGPQDQVQAIGAAVEELRREGPGDILVFLSGEREIRDTAEALRGLEPGRHDRAGIEILPLYARLSAAEQHRVFHTHPGRRIVLATNVAETSLTVPGIRYVVDPGTARVSRYSHRTKVQRLPIEAVSQASANQRAGRCGRVAPGICIRLYSEEDLASRPEYTEPEILRTNLASVILQMTALGLGEVAAFPFVDPPDARNVRDGIALLEELGAFASAGDGAGAGGGATSRRGRRARGGRAAPGGRRLSPVGRRLALLPLDPRLGRMVLAGTEHGCVREVMVLAAALSIQDPRERPAERREEADALHARFSDPGSDFLSYLALWQHLQEAQSGISSNQFRRLCRAEHLNYLRVREWQDVYGQLRQVVTRELGGHLNHEPAGPDRIHRALLAGLLSHVGMRPGEGREYTGARGARFMLWPGSGLAARPPRWVMAAELVETGRLWGRVAARIRPEWAEQAGAHLVRRTYGPPRWERRRAAAVADERVTLYGLPLVTDRTVTYRRVDPAGARDVFIQHALVEGDWEAEADFLAANRKTLEEIRALEDRARRRDLLVDDAVLFHLYDGRVPASVTDGREFRRWWDTERRLRPDLLTFSANDVMNPDAGAVSPASYPDSWRQGDLELELTYEFEPGSELDGVSAVVPAGLIDRVAPDGFDWQVPGLRAGLVTALIRSLPKPLRRHFVPVPEHAAAFLASHGPDDGPLLEVLSGFLARRAGEAIGPGSFQRDKVPAHLLMTFRVAGADGRLLAAGKDLAALRAALRTHARRGLSRRETGTTGPAAGPPESARTWVFGEIPRSVDETFAGIPVRRYPALVDRGDGVTLEALDSPGAQQAAHWAGNRRLLLLAVPSPAREVVRGLPRRSQLALVHPPGGGTTTALLEDCVTAAADHLLAGAGGPAWEEAGFARLEERFRRGLRPETDRVVRAVTSVLSEAGSLQARIDDLSSPPAAGAGTDVSRQVAALLFPGFVAFTGVDRLADLSRYLEAAGRRLDSAARDPGRDRRHAARVNALRRRLDRLVEMSARGAPRPELRDIHWMIEEYRVSLWAQQLGTKGPVSEERISRALDRLESAGP